ncbi:hypothetical protein AWENTII_004566 [Aspergillus wentii]
MLGLGRLVDADDDAIPFYSTAICLFRYTEIVILISWTFHNVFLFLHSDSHCSAEIPSGALNSARVFLFLCHCGISSHHRHHHMEIQDSFIPAQTINIIVLNHFNKTVCRSRTCLLEICSR